MLVVHDDAAGDLRALRAREPNDVLLLAAFLDQLRRDPRLQEELLTERFGADGDEKIGVKKWQSVQRKEKLPVWRLRVWDLEDKGLSYRIVYFYYWPEQTFYVMAVCRRGEIDYDDPSNIIRKRVIERIRIEFPDA